MCCRIRTNVGKNIFEKPFKNRIFLFLFLTEIRLTFLNSKWSWQRTEVQWFWLNHSLKHSLPERQSFEKTYFGNGRVVWWEVYDRQTTPVICSGFKAWSCAICESDDIKQDDPWYIQQTLISITDCQEACYTIIMVMMCWLVVEILSDFGKWDHSLEEYEGSARSRLA